MLLSTRTADNEESYDEKKERETYGGGGRRLHILGHVGCAVSVCRLCGVSTEGAQKQSFSPEVLKVVLAPASNKEQSEIDDVLHANSAWEVWWGCPLRSRRRPFVTWSDLSCLHFCVCQGKSSPRCRALFTLVPKQELAAVWDEVCEHDSVGDRLVGKEPTHSSQRQPASARLLAMFLSPFAATCNFPSSSVQQQPRFRNTTTLELQPSGLQKETRPRGSRETHQWAVIGESGHAASVIVFDSNPAVFPSLLCAPRARRQRVPPQWVRSFHRLEAGRGADGSGTDGCA